MESHRPSGAEMQFVRLGIAMGLAMLFLAASILVSAAAAHATTSAPASDAGATESLSNDAVITIGVGAAQSVVPDLGWRQVNAAQLAVNQANAAGGVNIAGTNYTLALAVANDGCNAAQGSAAAYTLLNAGAVAVVGYTCSSASRAAQPIHAAAGVSMITPSSTSNDLTEQGHATTFRVISRDDGPPILLATYLRNWLHLEKAAIVQIDGFWGNWATEVASTTFTSLGGTVTSRRTVPSTAGFTAALTAIQAEDPDVIFYSDANASNAGLLSSVAHGLGMTDVVIAWNTFSEDESVLAAYAAQAGAAAEGDHAAMFYRRTQDMPGYGAFNAAYQAAGFANYGDEATATGAFAYDAANIIIAAIRRAQSTDPTAIRNAIASTANYQGVVGTYMGFNSKGDVIPQWAWLERYSNGQWMLAQQILYVDGTAGQDTESCGAKATPCRSISHTLAGQQSWGATLHVAGGLYRENLVIGASVRILGGYDPTTWERNLAAQETVVNGALPPGGATFSPIVHHPVVEVTNDEAEVLLDGLTLTGGGGEFAGGVLANNSAVTIRNCYIHHNHADGTEYSQAGAGVLALHGRALVIENSRIVNNTMGMQPGGAAGIRTHTAPLTLINTVVADNRGEMAVHTNASATIINSTVANNDGGVLVNPPGVGTLNMLNSIVYGTEWAIGLGDQTTANVRYSLVEGGYPGQGNIGVDPQFVNAADGNYRLRWGSTAIDAGTNNGAPPFDLEGVARPQDGNFDGVRVTDMGAYERAPRSVYLPVIHRRATAGQ